ncbi:MAG: glutamyl-tRNA reductase [Leptospirales bacterium]|nr:glutamyl-tRNA reductase [Leptospirales bacterium]
MDRSLSDVAVIGFNHKSASVEKRECFSIHADKYAELYSSMKDKNIGEAVYLATCNRVETYIASQSISVGVDAVIKLYEELSGLKYDEFKNSLYIKYSRDAVSHIMSVISSLDSMVLGETEIVGQMKDAFSKAVSNKSVGALLNKLFHQAFKAAKQVRSETDISKNPISIAFIAADMARAVCPDLESKKALLVGAGQMGSLTLKYLTKHGVGEIIIANRSLHNAERIAEELNTVTKVALLDEIYEIINDIDIVITSVSAPHYMITSEMLQKVMEARPSHPLVLIDIAVPRNVEPSVGEIEGVHLYNIDSLKEIADDNLQNRLSEARIAEEYISENVDEFLNWKDKLSVTPVITSIQNRFEEIRGMELERYRKKKLKHLSLEDFTIVEELTKQIMTRTLHNPIMNLKKQHLNVDSGNIDIESLKHKTRFIEEIFAER